MDIEVRQPQARGQDKARSGKSKGGGANPDMTKAIVAGVILVLAAGVMAWQFGLFNFGGNKPDPVVIEQQTEEWDEVQTEQEEYWKKYERTTGRKRPNPAGS